jgi:hypothetical protein
MKREFQDLKARNFKRKEGEAPKKAIKQEQPAGPDLVLPEPKPLVPMAPEAKEAKVEDETIKKLGPHISNSRREKRKFSLNDFDSEHEQAGWRCL